MKTQTVIGGQLYVGPKGASIKEIKYVSGDKIKTYQVILDNGDIAGTFDVKDGEKGADGVIGKDGNGIKSIEKTGTSGLVDTYTIAFTNGSSTTFTVTNGHIGKDGKAATITVGTVTTGNAGSKAVVTNAGTENAAKFNFTIPKGDKGDKGDTGSVAGTQNGTETGNVVTSVTLDNATKKLIYHKGFTAASAASLNDYVTLSTTQTITGQKTFAAPTNIDKQEQATVWFNTANDGRIGFGKEGPNSGTGIFFDQVSGTRRLNFRASATKGAMVWSQPEAGAKLYFDLGGGPGYNRITMPTGPGTLALQEGTVNNAKHLDTHSASDFLLKSGGTMAGQLNMGSGQEFHANEHIVFDGQSNPYIKMISAGTSYYFQAASGQFGLGPTWAKATRWDKDGKMTVYGTSLTAPEIYEGAERVALKNHNHDSTYLGINATAKNASKLENSTKQEIINTARENKLDKTNESHILYGTDSAGTTFLWKIYKDETLPKSNINGIPKYNYSSGTLSTNTPLVDRDCTNKKYVDDELSKKQPVGDYALKSELFSKDYNDLNNKPTFTLNGEVVKNPNFVAPIDEGEVKTKFRVSKKGYTENVQYFPICKLPINNSGNYASLLITGRLGGWVDNNMSFFQALAYNRGTCGISTLDIAGSGNSTDVYNYSNIVIYEESDKSATIYIKANSYYTFDLDLELYQASAKFLYDGVAKTPTGALKAAASTTTSRMELYQGKLYINNKEIISKTRGDDLYLGKTETATAANKVVNPLTITGRDAGTYDGSVPKTINIPNDEAIFSDVIAPNGLPLRSVVINGQVWSIQGNGVAGAIGYEEIK